MSSCTFFLRFQLLSKHGNLELFFSVCLGFRRWGLPADAVVRRADELDFEGDFFFYVLCDGRRDISKLRETRKFCLLSGL